MTDKCMTTVRRERLDAIIVIGGDGTMACAAPIAADRILATNFGFHAMAVLASGSRNRMVVRENNIFSDIDL